VTDMKVMVMSGAQMRWILEHDYGAGAVQADPERLKPPGFNP
jgi:hypothetical protein